MHTLHAQLLTVKTKVLQKALGLSKGVGPAKGLCAFAVPSVVVKKGVHMSQHNLASLSKNHQSLLVKPIRNLIGHSSKVIGCSNKG